MTTSTDRLSKHYGALGAPERFRLAVNAQLRGDHVEADRLIDSAPTVTRNMPHISGRCSAFVETLNAQWILRLDCAGMMYRALAFDLVTGANRDTDHPAARAYAHTLLSHRAAWSMFCRLEGIDGADRQAESHGGELVASAERIAEGTAFSAPEMLAYVRRGDPAAEAPPTHEERARMLRDYFAERLRYWRAE